MCFFEVAKIVIIYYMCSLWHLSRPDFCLEGVYSRPDFCLEGVYSSVRLQKITGRISS